MPLVLLSALFALLFGAAATAAPVPDPAQTAADALVAQGCTIKRTTARFIEVTCSGQPITRIMRMPRA